MDFLGNSNPHIPPWVGFPGRMGDDVGGPSPGLASLFKRVLYLREVRGCHNNKAAFLHAKSSQNINFHLSAELLLGDCCSTWHQRSLIWPHYDLTSRWWERHSLKSLRPITWLKSVNNRICKYQIIKWENGGRRHFIKIHTERGHP